MITPLLWIMGCISGVEVIIHLLALIASRAEKSNPVFILIQLAVWLVVLGCTIFLAHGV